MTMERCLICEGKTEALFDGQFGLTYYSCPGCGFIAQDRAALVTFEEEREEYDRHENSIENEGYVAYFKRFLEASLLPYRDGERGLDYGSGPEPVLSQVLARDYGLDVDIYDLHYQPDKVFEGKAYDFITTTEVIEHVKDPVAFLQTFYDLLRPGGVVALMTLFHPQDKAAFLDWWYRRDITHISFFTPETFRVMAKGCGFEVVFCDNHRYVTLKK